MQVTDFYGSNNNFYSDQENEQPKKSEEHIQSAKGSINCLNNLGSSQGYVKINISDNGKYHISLLPEEILQRIFLCLSPQYVARCTLLDKRFCQLTNEAYLWRLIADSQSLVLKDSIPAKEQVKNAFITSRYTKAVINLKFYDNSGSISIRSLFRHSQKDIEKKGGICLISDFSLSAIDSESIFVGIALTSHKAEDGNKWCLRFCSPTVSFNEEYFNEDYLKRMMPKVIKKLEELQIVPDYVVENGKASERKFFEEWQKQQKI